MQNYSIRPITLDDLEAVVHHRESMSRELKSCDEETIGIMAVLLRPWLTLRIATGEYLGWFAISEDGTVGAGLGLWILDWPPGFTGVASKRGYVLNVYTEPAHRRQGLARRLMSTALDWAGTHELGLVSLHASPYGRPLYESFEFVSTNEMRRVLSH